MKRASPGGVLIWGIVIAGLMVALTECASAGTPAFPFSTSMVLKP
jgi:hypothetical protein